MITSFGYGATTSSPFSFGYGTAMVVLVPAVVAVTIGGPDLDVTTGALVGPARVSVTTEPIA